MNRNIMNISVGAVVVAVLYGCGYLNTALIIVASVISFLMGVVAGLSMVLCSGKMQRPNEPNVQPMVSTLLLTKMMEERQNMKVPQRKIVMSVNLDMVIHSIFDLVMRDYVMSWYTTIAKDEERFNGHVEKEVWYMLEQFSERLSKIDKVHFMTKPVVQKITKHFKNIRQATTEPSETGEKRKFFLHPWLASDERESEFLRKVADVFLIYLLPQPYSLCPSVRHLLREIVACRVFKQAVDLICEPDYFNTKVLGWLEYREQLALEHKRTYTYAATYEEFMKKIKECNDLEPLKQMRYNIISEIMQATTIQNLKRAKGMDTEKETVPTGTSKGDLLKARNLTRYIKQLTVTKAACEKRIHWLGGPDYSSYTADTRREEHQNMPGKKILSFNLIMESATVRSYLLKYLHKDGNDALLRFWTAVENLKLSHKKEWHAMASEIYQMFITHPTSLVRLKLTRGLIKGMEAFMTGDTGPDAFYDAQAEIYQIVEEEHYHSFILSDIYHRCITSMDERSQSTDSIDDDNKISSRTHKKSPDQDDVTAKFAEHSTYAQQKLQDLDNKILNKTQAVKALKSSQKPDPKIKKLLEEIEAEIESLRSDRRQLEFHIDRTEVWAENVGRWKAHIYNSEVVQEEDEMVAYFVIVIHLPGAATIQPHGITGYTQGWVISRKLADFRALHQQVIQISPDLKNVELPRGTKRWFKTISTDFLNKAKEQLEFFLLTVLQDDRLAQSEAVYAFYSPSPEHLKQAPTLPKRAKFSLTNLFKGMSGTAPQDSDSDDELLFVDEEGWKEEHGKDYIAKPMYLLINEVFELRGMFKWLRRTLMAFVKVSFGRSINRQIRDTVGWIVSEPMMIYYLEQFRDAYWPDGQLAEDWAVRTDEQKLHTRLKSKEKFLSFITESLKGMVGERNAQRGSIKFFEAMQDDRLNKHLFYELLEVFLYELFPELTEHHQHWKSDGTDSASEADSAVLQQQLAASNMIPGF